MKTLMMLQALNTYQEQIKQAQKDRDVKLAQIQDAQQQTNLGESQEAVNVKTNYDGIMRTVNDIQQKLMYAKVTFPPDPTPKPIAVADTPKRMRDWRNDVIAKLQDIDELMAKSPASDGRYADNNLANQNGRLRVAVGLPILLLLADFIFSIGDLLLFNPILFLFIDSFENANISPDSIFSGFMVTCIIMACIRLFVSGLLSALARLVYFLISLNYFLTSFLLTFSILLGDSSRNSRDSGWFDIDFTPSPETFVFFVPLAIAFLIMTWMSLQNRLPYSKNGLAN